MPDAQHAAERRVLAAYYDRLAPVYGEGEHFGARRAAVLNAIAEEIARARAVLDLGCGNGAYWIEFAASRGAVQIVGVDLSSAMLDAARRRVRGPTGLVQADALALPFAAGRFDLVFMSHVLQLVPDVEACLKEAARNVVSGGRLVATVGTTGWREMVRQFADPEDLQEFAAVFAAARLRTEHDDETRVTAACDRVGLHAAWRRAPFSVAWPALEEWVRLRWLTVVDETLRPRAERWLDTLRSRAADRTLELAERVLVAHTP